MEFTFDDSKARNIFKNRRSKQSPNDIAETYNNSLNEEPKKETSKSDFSSEKAKSAFKKREAKESWGKSLLRTLYQIPSGIGQAFTYPLDVLNMIATGAAFDPGDMEDLRRVSEREGIPFDEDRYLKGVQEASELFPTQGNFERYVENETGFPTQPKTGFQKGLKLASTAGKITPGTLGEKGVAAATAPTVSTGLHAIGLPEPIAETLGLVAGGVAGSRTPSLDLGKSTKPSGLVERRFEKTTSPRDIPESRLEKINKKLEGDFKNISDKIIAESPVGETAQNLKNDPTFKQASRELLEEAQTIADTIPETLPAKMLKDELVATTEKNVKGFSLGEYDKNYIKYLKEAGDDILTKDLTAGQMVEQYRKNNKALSEYFEPGSSKAVNRAKRDSLLDQNRAIATTMEKAFPESELVPVFKEGNARWTKIKDVEAIDEFVSDIFSGQKIDYKKVNDFFDKEGYARIFKRSLGEEGFKEFEQLMKDMLTSETPYKMLKVAKEKGWGDLVKKATPYLLHKNLGLAKTGFDAVRGAYKGMINAMLDKPQLAVTLRKGVSDIKKGNFQAATKEFETLEKEIESVHPEITSKEKINTHASKAEVLGESKLPDWVKDHIEAGIQMGDIKSKEDIIKFLEKHQLTKIKQFEEESGRSFEAALEEYLNQYKPNNSPPRGEEFNVAAEEIKPQRARLEHKDESIKSAVEIHERAKESTPNIKPPVIEPKKEIKPKQPKKTKLQAMEEAQEVMKENFSKRNMQWDEAKKSGNKQIIRERKKQVDNAHQRIKDIEEEIGRLNEMKPVKKSEKINQKSKELIEIEKELSTAEIQLQKYEKQYQDLSQDLQKNRQYYSKAKKQKIQDDLHNAQKGKTDWGKSVEKYENRKRERILIDENKASLESSRKSDTTKKP